MFYDGDLHQVDRVLQWLTSQDVFELKNEIEEVNRKMLDKLLEENEFLAVYFCKFSLILNDLRAVNATVVNSIATQENLCSSLSLVGRLVDRHKAAADPITYYSNR